MIKISNKKFISGFTPLNSCKANLTGFTLIELLIVIGIIAIVTAIVLIAVNPGRQLAQTRNSQRRLNIRAIQDAVNQRIIDKGGEFAPGNICDDLPTIKSIITSTPGSGNVDLCNCLVPDYIAGLPYDPQTGHYTDCTDYNTGYTIIYQPTTGRFTVTAPSAELGEFVSTLSGWPDSAFDKCREITLTGGDSELTNLPYYINLPKDPDMQDDYDDLKFYDVPCNNGGTGVDYEIEKYSSLSAEIWVRISSLPASGKTISVYYGNSTAASAANPFGVWDSDYKMVHHLEETPPGNLGTVSDSTSNINNGTTRNGVITDVTGRINGADEFNGVNDYIDTLLNNLPAGNSSRTMSVWIYSKNVTNIHDIYGYGRAGDNQTFGGIVWDGNLYFWGWGPGDFDTGVDIPLNSWQHIAFSYDGTNVRTYYNGVLVNTTSKPSLNTVLNRSAIGRNHTLNLHYWDGRIDELRISSTVRSGSWIKQSYQMVENQNTFVIVGNEQIKP